MGQVFIGLVALTGIMAAAHIGVKCSFRCRVECERKTTVRNMSYRTQQLLMLYVTAVAHVLDAWAAVPLQRFMSTVLSSDVRQSFDAVYKTTVARLMEHDCSEVGE